MIGRLLIKAGLAAAYLLVLAQTASAITLVCVTQNPSSRDWVPDAVFVAINPGEWQAAVYDEFTQQTFKGPIRAKLSQPTPTRVKLAWKLIGVKDTQGRKQNVDFKMTLNFKRNTFTYNGLGESFFVAPGSAAGKCAEAKEKDKK